MRIVLVSISLFCCQLLTAQTAPMRFWVQFSDKANSSFSVDQPNAFLTENAIARREKMGIPITEEDIPVSTDYINQVLDLGEIYYLHESKWFNSISILVPDSALMLQVSALPFVVSTRQVKQLKTSPVPEAMHQRSNETIVPSEYGESLRQIEMLNGLPLHALGYQGEGMNIGVLDAGFRFVNILPVFENARSEFRIAGLNDFVDLDLNVDGHSNHGTYVLSTMAGYAEGELIGTAPNASYFLFRTEDSDSEFIIEEDNWVAGIERCDFLGMDLVNSSLGYSTFDNPDQNHSYADMDGETTRISIAARIASRKGMIVVTSAGNSGASAWKYITAPGDAKEIITVGAVDAEEKHAAFSSFGPSFDGRVKPDVMAMGAAATFASLDSTFIQGNGTSFASPILCGMTACLWQAHPNKSNTEIMDAVKQSAHLYTTPNDSMGYGIPNFWTAHLLLRETETSNDSKLTLYPNPTSGNVRFELEVSDSDEPRNVRVYDASGRIVYDQCFEVLEDQVLGELQLPSDLTPGTYFVEVSGVVSRLLFLKE